MAEEGLGQILAAFVAFSLPCRARSSSGAATESRLQADYRLRSERTQAEHYIYIENQYFLGSSHCWEADRHAGATHLVPIEIALKIVSKIRDGERFMAYIVIPLFPEGM